MAKLISPRDGITIASDIQPEHRPKTANASLTTALPLNPFDVFESLCDAPFTKQLIDAATISIPVPSQSSASLIAPPKYRTMPSTVTRAHTILPDTKCLNEIFEEGTDIGSSDTSTTTTPRPLVRHQISSSRANNHSGAASHSAQRRSKLHKSRTASCSSSDDDDSENRKKRAHKIEDSAKAFQSHRRDSHDDSSDSQDPSNNAATSSGTNSGAGTLVNHLVATTSNDNQTQNETKASNDTNQNGRQKANQAIGFRKTRAGRRRAGETRLRESQSLNRITEVQESEVPLASILSTNRGPTDTSTSNASVTDSSSATTFCPCTNIRSSHTTATIAAIACAFTGPRIPAGATASAPSTTASNKTSRLGFKLFHGFRKSESASAKVAKAVVESSTKSQSKCAQHGDWLSHRTDGGHDDTRCTAAIEKGPKSSSSAAKKLKMLGRYFQVR